MATLIYSKSEIKIKKRQIKIEVPGERDNFMVRKKKKNHFFQHHKILCVKLVKIDLETA